MNMSEKDLLALVAIVIAVLAVFSLSGGGMGFMMGPGMMGGFGGFGLGMAIFWILIIVGVYFLFVGYVQPRGCESDRSLEIAKERYARGEINEEEYEKIRKKLSE